MTGRRPELSTGGGTSDARFIKDACPVVEFGLVGATIHAVDERVALADLEALSPIYERAFDRYFAAFARVVDAAREVEPADRRRDRAAAAAIGGFERGLEVAGGRPARRRPRPASRPSSAPADAGTTAPLASIWTSSPSRMTSSRSSVRIGDFAWHWESRKVEKSCWPISACAASCIAAASRRRLHPPGAAALERRAARGG